MSDLTLRKDPREMTNEELVAAIDQLDHEVSKHAETFAKQLCVDYEEAVRSHRVSEATTLEEEEQEEQEQHEALLKDPEEMSDEELIAVFDRLDCRASEHAETFAKRLGVDYEEAIRSFGDGGPR